MSAEKEEIKPRKMPTGRPFSKDNPPKNPGRKPGLAKMLSSVTDVSRKQIEDTVKSILFETTQEEAAKILNDKEACLFVKACTMAALNAIAKGDMTTIDQLVEWAYTKKREMKVELSGQVNGRPLIETSVLSKETMAEIAQAYAEGLDSGIDNGRSGEDSKS
jgi:transcription initiation factor IIF auxiliary subunit